MERKVKSLFKIAICNIVQSESLLMDQIEIEKLITNFLPNIKTTKLGKFYNYINYS